MSLRSPLARVLGPGAAGDGTAHWWAQRVSAIAMVLLGLWFAISVIGMDLGSHAAVVAWASGTFNTVMLVLLVAVACYHSHLGTQVVIEDYSRGWARVAGLVAVQFIHVVLAGVGIVAVLRLGSGG